MDQKYAKDSLEYYKKVLENSVKMYDTTIKEMTERKSNQESLSFVIRMKRDTEGQIREIDEALENMEKNNKSEFIIVYNELTEKLKSFNPFTRNRFMVDFENDEIKDFFVESVSYSKNSLCIRFRNSEAFFAPEYSYIGHFTEVPPSKGISSLLLGCSSSTSRSASCFSACSGPMRVSCASHRSRT